MKHINYKYSKTILTLNEATSFATFLHDPYFFANKLSLKELSADWEFKNKLISILIASINITRQNFLEETPEFVHADGA